MAELLCISCKTKITNDTKSTKFPCPECGEIIIRCGKCRKLGTKWICKNCGTEGP